jgi:hypothetical protein
MIPLVLTTPDLDSLFMTYEKFRAMFVENARFGDGSEPGASPNAGPAKPLGNSGVSGGPPSAS